MSDDESLGFISSGKKMRVSVSERTGNAKTPKNIVTSDEEATLNRVRTFEGKEGEFDPLAQNLAKEQDLRLDKIVTKPSQDVKADKAPADKSLVENLQTIKQEPSANNTQLAPSNSGSSANKQSVKVSATNVNQQTIASDKSNDNRQGIAKDNLQDNLQSIQAESLQDNLQNIARESLNNNIQSTSNPQVASKKPEDIAKEALRTNDAGIAKETIQTNDAGIAKQNIKDQDARIEKEQVKSNIASIQVDTPANNKQSIKSAPVSDNSATAPKETHHETRQALGKDSFQDRAATVAKASVDGNVQAVPTKPAAGNNLQPIDQKPIADHFEALPGDPRPSGPAATVKDDPIANKASAPLPQPAAAKALAAQARPLVKPQKVTPSSVISSAEAQKIALAHKAQMEAFHGRLAGIKHNVDKLNNKLDDLENKS